jgi:hypothetical protein
MAIGFPVKANYASGDILTAAQMNDLSGTLNYMDPTAKGDLFPASSGTALTRLAVGNNGETLVADSSTSTGLRYQATQAAGRNYFINGGFDIWQRSTSYALTSTQGSYGAADRWGNVQDSSPAATASQITTGLPNGFRYGLKVQRTAGSTSTGVMRTFQVLETASSIPLANQTVTFSFWAKAGANYSQTSNILNTYFATGTGTDQSASSMAFGTWTGYTQTTNNATLTTSWQRFSYNITIPSTATQLGITFSSTPTGTAGADDSYQLTGIQLELGSVATAFTRAGGTIQGELAACQRYFYSHASGDSKSIGNSAYYSATAIYGTLQFPVTMRVAPTAAFTSGTDYYVNAANGGNDLLNQFSADRFSTTSCWIYNDNQASGNIGFAGVLRTNNASASLAFTAEL